MKSKTLFGQYISFALVVVSFFGMSFITGAQVSRDSVFSRVDLLEDLDSLKNTILISHPNPFAFCGEEAFFRAYESAVDQIKEGISVLEFSHIVAKFIGVIEDSHTTIDYGQMADMMFSKEGDYVVPFSVYRSDDENGLGFNLLVTSDWEDVLPKGGRLLSINGMDIYELYDIAMDYASLEGDAEQAQQMVAATLVGFINTLFNSVDSLNVFDVIPYGEETSRTFELKGYQSKEYKRLRKERNSLDAYKWIKTDYDAELSTAVLRVQTFAPPTRSKFKKHVKNTFKQIAKEGYQNLIIDLRGNGGGSSSWVEYLYSFLDTEGYNTPNNVIGRNSELALSRGFSARNTFTKGLLWLFYRHNEDVQSYKYFSNLPIGTMDTIFFKDKKIQKNKFVFKRNSYLLINGLSASASVDFTNAFSTKKRGVIVGQPCLGPHTGTWGNPAKYYLPSTGLAVTISTIRYNYDATFVYQKEAIQPDYTVSKEAEDLSKGIDTQLEFVKNLIRSKQ